MGFDFGWKSPDPGCVANSQTYNGGYLGKTSLRQECTDCETNLVGYVSIRGLPVVATISVSSAHIIFGVSFEKQKLYIGL